MDTSLKNLEEALSIRRQTDTLENRLTSLLGTAPSRSASKAGSPKMSPQARAKIAAAMRARWAKRKRTGVGKPGAKERWAHTGGTEKAFATHESPVGSEKKSRRAEITHEEPNPYL